MATDYAAMSDDELFEEVGRQFNAEAQDHTETDVGFQFNPLESALEIGRKIFSRVNLEMYGLCCGEGRSDKADRAKLLAASGISSAALNTFLIGYITLHFGLGVAVASALAALLAKRIIRPAGEELCNFWSEHLTM